MILLSKRWSNFFNRYVSIKQTVLWVYFLGHGMDGRIKYLDKIGNLLVFLNFLCFKDRHTKKKNLIRCENKTKSYQI